MIISYTHDEEDKRHAHVCDNCNTMIVEDCTKICDDTEEELCTNCQEGDDSPDDESETENEEQEPAVPEEDN